MLWQNFDNRLIYTATLVAQTGLRIGGSGQAADPAVSDLPVIKDARGTPFIPGSSLRGALRSHVERIVRTFQPEIGNGQGACNPLDEKQWCVTKHAIDDWEAADEENRDEERAAWLLAETCAVCRVFGSPWLASRVRFNDLFGAPTVRAETRDGVAIDRDKETVKEGGKFDFETVPAGSRFSLEVVADNLDERERGMLWLGLEELKRGQIFVGGFKGRGLGRVVLENESLRMVDGSDRKALRQYLLNGELPPVGIEQAATWMEKFVDSLGG